LGIYFIYRTDPSIPTRPAGQRPPPLRDPNRPANYFFNQPFGNSAFHRGGMSISAGFGMMPLGVTFVSLVFIVVFFLFICE
jgi:E3 ubiquitin-protein ligase RNF5